ncbi:DUF4132 domain-containing protein [Paludibaculum fermentans]|uniref:DUF4132 domain-containing protein n=1 Tax=Paludibaculum fermentans TaxID=1473598 RepID=A0A7S7NL84_PALFE|nr:DUF4132 domain-containing protein [Paludibaculum fermentans]QOY85697.1 DUF4132 domain-containing protein [Paludibaculum fermentans]
MAKIEEFPPQAGHPLGSEHEAISRWIRDVARPVAYGGFFRPLEIKSTESGRILWETPPEGARRLILACLEQVSYFDAQVARVRAEGKTDMDRLNPQTHPEWIRWWTPRQAVESLISALLRRALPFTRSDLLALIEWCIGPNHPSFYQVSVSMLTQAIQRYIAAHELDTELREATRAFAVALRSSHNRESSRMGTTLEQICGRAGLATEEVEPPRTAAPPPEPAPVGTPLVLNNLKLALGITNTVPEHTGVQIEPDRFPLPPGSPLSWEHGKLTELLTEILEADSYHNPVLGNFAAGREVLALDPPRRGRMMLAAAERYLETLLGSSPDYLNTRVWQANYAVAAIARTLIASGAQFDREGLFDFLLYLSMRAASDQLPERLIETVLNAIEEFTGNGANLSDGERFVLHLWRGARVSGPPLGIGAPEIERITEWIGDSARFYLVPGEAWSDALNADIASLDGASRSRWVKLLEHLLGASSSRPSGKWKKATMLLVAELGEAQFREAMERWLPLVARGRTLLKAPGFLGDTRGAADSMHDENANALRGLLWSIPLLPQPAGLARLVGSVALSSYKKIPGIGPRAVKAGNAAVYALSEMVSPEAMGQLAMLKVRVRFGTAQKEIEKAFDGAAQALELPRDQVEEMSVPACGLESVGRREEVFGEYRAELAVTGSEAELKWFDAKGKPLKSIPAAVKKSGGETLKELQQGLSDVKSMLSAQRDRVDALFLERKSWPAEVWRERYVDHPLVGTIGRRLIWSIGETAVTVADGEALDVQGNRHEIPEGALVSLWHPTGKSIDEVVAWRRRIEELDIVQPFKQAHREVYLLTDAEQQTSTYSNRFAGHILRQHQFNALCGARRWKNKLRLLVDDSYPPASRELTAWGLRAEFWVEGVGTDYGADTNDAGVYHRLATDQVRFYRIGAAQNAAHAGGGGYCANAMGPGVENINEPLRLDQIPELVLSEIMRDVDLFVGVSSIGNDPTWQDGGHAAQHGNYWASYSFGALSATAVTRRETLQRLVPRLKIAGRCTLTERFLEVRGDRRTYKIHLGSGNILMEPNDQYLCIVRDARAGSAEGEIYLPFEGDLTLAVILSKAFLLAEDKKIKDTTINRQIDAR